MSANESVVTWPASQVKEWLIANGFSKYAHLLCDMHKINGTALLMLTEEDLKNPPLKIEVLGDVKILSLLINNLRLKCNKALGDEDLPFSSVFTTNVQAIKNCSRSKKRSQVKNHTGNGFSSQVYSATSMISSREIREESPDLPDLNFHSGTINYFTSPADGNPKSHGMAIHLEPEYWKTFLSVGYFVCVTIITCLVMVIVHDRVPDMKKYPPLPDIFLDNVPLIPWAFGMCEITGCVLALIWIGVLICHKHRFILMRRFFALMGTVFLLRCFTMLITSLSVPGSHLECAPRPYGDFWAKFAKALEIWEGFGMSVQGVRTCGDYMFSGHTVTLTMLNFFITEYTPRRVYFLHTFTWILNLFGIFFILAAREHYSIDVFVAFYITSRIFLYYHTLANSRALKQRDQYRARVWFPLFSFFEARIDGVVPNEYQKPWRLLTIATLSKFIKRIVHLAKEKLKLSINQANNKKSKKKN